VSDRTSMGVFAHLAERLGQNGEVTARDLYEIYIDERLDFCFLDAFAGNEEILEDAGLAVMLVDHEWDEIVWVMFDDDRLYA